MDPLDIPRFMQDLEEAVRRDKEKWDLSKIKDTLGRCAELLEDLRVQHSDDYELYASLNGISNDLEEAESALSGRGYEWPECFVLIEEGVRQYNQYQWQESFKKRKKQLNPAGFPVLRLLRGASLEEKETDRTHRKTRV